MKGLYCIMLAFVAFALPASAQQRSTDIPPASASTPPPPSITAPEASSYIVQQDMLCETDSDCASVETECPGWRGINRKFAAQAEQHVMAVRPYIFCESAVEARSKPEASCRDKLCRIPPQ